MTCRFIKEINYSIDEYEKGKCQIDLEQAILREFNLEKKDVHVDHNNGCYVTVSFDTDMMDTDSSTFWTKINRIEYECLATFSSGPSNRDINF